MGGQGTKEQSVVHDRELIKASWSVIEKDVGIERLSQLTYSDLLRRGDTDVRHIFAHTHTAEQQRMILVIIEWLINPPPSEAINKAAVAHAHLGVRPSNIELFSESFIRAVTEVLREANFVGSIDDTAASWGRGLKGITQPFSETCEECRKALHYGQDDSNSTDQKRNKYLKTLRSLLTLGNNNSLIGPRNPSGLYHAGYLMMSQYSRNKWPPPVTEKDHSHECFRKRWIELNGQFVYYYKNKGDPPMGLIDLAACQLIDTDAKNSILPRPSRFSFALRTQVQEYPYYFMADGDNSKESWFSMLKRACNRFSLIREDLFVGERLKVWVQDVGAFKLGTCAYVGKLSGPAPSGNTPHQEGLWVGVILDEPVGSHDGKVGGKQYFRSQKNHGILVPANQVASTGHLDIQVHGDHLASSSYTPEHFTFLTVIGKGSFGRVCKVRENATGRIFACKVLQKAALVKESQIKNIRREKSILLNITHPYIVKLHAAFQTRGRLFLLFDFLSGGELFYHMTQGERYFPEMRARFYIAEVSLAIAHLHANQILHRDLKAENLVLDADGHVVLTDFGFAKTIEPDVINTTKCGTLPYMAPEILKQGPQGYSYEVDWWALGVLLFLMLTGCYPFWHTEPKESVRQILYREILPDNFPPRPRLSREARDLVCWLLQKDPAKRLSSHQKFMEHSWFTGFDWEACKKRALTPPFVPDMSGRNTKYFDVDPSTDLLPVQSNQLPEQWVGKEAFASFYDVHRDYKNPVPDDEEDEEFLRALNDREDRLPDLKSPSGLGKSSPCPSHSVPRNFSFTLDT
eukprot:Sspe_Gene.15774::Locus_5498_Transcript_1_1_Confidence_1.000_Length_2469::g.15774::m.15774/K13302/SGK1; serum/glucocorticoid-regulated kinase 1